MVSYTKAKQKYKCTEWIITTQETASEIMLYDKKTMHRLSESIYGKSYKGDRRIVIVMIRDKKIVGQTNYNE